MSELLLCVKDMGKTGNLIFDSAAPKQGDVIDIKADSSPWGECELGGPTYTHYNTTVISRDVQVLVDTSVDLTTLTNPRSLSKNQIVAYNIGEPITLSDDTGLPAQIGNVAVSTKDRVLSYTQYERKVVGTETRSIAEHPHGNHSFWRVIKLPKVSPDQIASLLTPELPTDIAHPSRYLQYRGSFLDKTKIPKVAMKVLIDFWEDDTRAQGFITLQYTAAQINNIISMRSPVVGP